MNDIHQITQLEKNYKNGNTKYIGIKSQCYFSVIDILKLKLLILFYVTCLFYFICL